jgi:hypothetical protein
MTLTVLLVVLTLIAVLAPRYGADSRDIGHCPFYTATPAADLRRLSRRLRRQPS